MNWQSLREILLSSDIVSPTLPQKQTHINTGLITVTCTFSSLSLCSCYPISFWSFCHVLQHSNPSIILTSPHSAALGFVSPFLSRFSFSFFFSPILCKSSLFLLPSVDSPPDSSKTAQGDFRGLKTQFSSLCFIYWGIKEKMESRCSLEMNTSRRIICLCGM